MPTWPPNDLEIARIQDDIRALEPAERKDAYTRLAQYYGVSESTVRRVIPIGGRKVRVDAGKSSASISVDAEEKIRAEQNLSPSVLVKLLEQKGEIEEGAISPDQARRVRNGQTQIKTHAPARTPRDPLPFESWCEKRISIKGAPWSLSRHEYLSEIYTALATDPYIAIRKAVQVGISTAVILNTLWRCDEYGHKCLYYLPTDEEAEDFSDDRVGADIISESDYLSDRVGDRSPRGNRGRDNTGLRHIGRGSHYVRGMFTKKRVKSIDGDLVVTDELDECNQENREFALDRISHSSLQHVRE
ncbi:MAG: phage terminase large subunit family protein, partial [Gemmatimonadota bacterium]|nr:phage terminase large subunit family protein [Gemmatimonadota bacterium]